MESQQNQNQQPSKAKQPTIVQRATIHPERAKTFQQLLNKHMLQVAKEHPEIFRDSKTGAPLTEQGIQTRATLMTNKLYEDSANKDGLGTQATLKELHIKNTYQAIIAYLAGSPESAWKR